MLAAYATRLDADDPLSALEVGDVPDPKPGDDGLPDSWVTVDVKAAALNHHDLWSLRGVGLSAEQLPMVLGCDAAGVGPDGEEVVVHAVIADAGAGGGDETLDPRRSLLSEKYPGALAEKVAVPRENLVPKPAGMSFAEAACLPTAWLTAYRMLVTKGRVMSGDAVLVQGCGGGVATAAVMIADALGATVYATSRDEAKRERVTQLGAQAFESGARLPQRVDVVIETVGEATFEHSLKSCKPGARIVVSGATSGHLPKVDLRRVFFFQLEVLGSTMGTRAELDALLQLCDSSGLRPLVDDTYPLKRARDAFARMASGELFGKLVLTP
jgi:NADPH:quinone reductase-like Zn-dependent oxidoreductase